MKLVTSNRMDATLLWVGTVAASTELADIGFKRNFHTFFLDPLLLADLTVYSIFFSWVGWR